MERCEFCGLEFGAHLLNCPLLLLANELEIEPKASHVERRSGSLVFGFEPAEQSRELWPEFIAIRER